MKYWLILILFSSSVSLPVYSNVTAGVGFDFLRLSSDRQYDTLTLSVSYTLIDFIQLNAVFKAPSQKNTVSASPWLDSEANSVYTDKYVYGLRIEGLITHPNFIGAQFTPYVKAGASLDTFEYSVTHPPQENNSLLFRENFIEDTETESGILFGAGFQYQFNQRISGFLDYNRILNSMDSQLSSYNLGLKFGF